MPAELGHWNAGGQQGCLHLLGWGRGGSPKWRKVFWGSLSQSGPNGTKVDPRPFAGFEFRPAPLLRSVLSGYLCLRVDSAVSTDTVAEGGRPPTVLVTPVAPGGYVSGSAHITATCAAPSESFGSHGSSFSPVSPEMLTPPSPLLGVSVRINYEHTPEG